MTSSRRRRDWSPVHGKQVKRLRERKGWTQEDLADEVRCYGAEQVRDWESGARQPQSRNQRRLATALEISVHDLLNPPPDIPPIPRGLTVLQILPVPERRTALYIPLLEQLESEKCECLPLDEFNVTRFWEELELEVGAKLNESDRDRALVGWARVASRAIILSGFQGLGNDLQESRSNWSIYRDLIKRLRDRCRLVVIQAVNPIHGPYFSSASSLAVDAQRHAFIPQDPSVIADQLLSELPDCCLDVVRDVLMSSTPIDEICSRELVDSGILRHEKGTLHLAHESWRDPWTKRLLGKR